MNVLITGGAGFIGSHLTDHLIKRGDKVLVIDNYATGRRDNLKPQAGLEIIEDTIANRELVFSLFERFRPDVVVHAAAAYKDPHDWHEDVLTNGVGGVNVIQAAEKFGAKRLIYFQTALCYGLHPKEQPITLTHPNYPDASSYSISKTIGENYVDLSKIDSVTFKLANVYGPRNISGPLPTFYHRLTEGKPCFVMDTRRDFVYVDDLVACVMKAIDGQGKGTYHLSSGGDFSIKELFDATLKALNIKLDKEVEVRPRGDDDAFTILLDPGRTEADFSWKTQVPLETGVANTIEYYKQFGITATYTHLKQIDEAKDKVKVG